MTSSKPNLREVLDAAAANAGDLTPVAKRLLEDSELDWVSGATISYAESGSHAYSMGGGNGSYTQSGGSFTQDGGGSFTQSSGVAEMHREAGENQ